MHWQYTPYTLPVVVAAVVSAGVAFLAWRRRPAAGATSFTLLMLTVTWYALATALTLSDATLSGQYFWTRMGILGLFTIPVALLAFALKYTGHQKWLTPRNVVLLLIPPLATQALAWTNNSHRLLFAEIRPVLDGDVLYLSFTRGAFMNVINAYAYLLLLLATFLLGRAFVRSPRLYRGQIGILLAGILPIWLVNAIQLLGLNPLPVPPTPLLFTLFGLTGTLSLYHYRLFDIMPVARDAIIESMDDAVIVLDVQDRVVDLNPAAEKIVGRTDSEAIGQPVAQVFPAWKDLAEAHRDAAEARTELALGRSGALRYFDLHLSSLYRRKRPAGRLIVLRDITEREQAAEAIRESERRLADIINFLPDATLVIDRQGQVIAWNRAIEEMTGIRADQMLGRGDYEYAIPFYGERRPILVDLVLLSDEEFITRYAKLQRRGSVLTGETYVPHLKGGARYLYATASALHDSKGNVVGAIEIIRDITEREQAAEAIRESERRLADIINFLPDATLVIDRQGQVIAWNRAIEEMTGIQADQMLGKGDCEYAIPFYGERRPILVDLVLLPEEEFIARYDHLQRQGAVLTGETYVPHLEGGARYLYATASALDDSKGNVVGAIELIRDITDRKRVEEERERLIEELDAYAHTVAHDLKNPLAIIVGYINVIKDCHSRLSDEDLREHLAAVTRASHKMVNIIDELLLLASVRQVDEVQAGPLDMAAIVGEAQKRLTTSIAESRAEIVAPDGWPVAVGHGPWVEEIWTNYLSNAIKYGGRPPRLVLGAGAQENGEVRFWVRDNGPGLEPEDQARLFVPFTRLNQARVEGQGLGLSIVRRIADKLGGRVGVESAPGQGSTFWFTLPAA
jgi:PAS domain S-box-containing protein